MLYDDVSATATFDAWFSLRPCSVGANETFTVEAVVNARDLHRTVTIRRRQPEFHIGRPDRPFSVMSSPTFLLPRPLSTPGLHGYLARHPVSAKRFAYPELNLGVIRHWHRSSHSHFRLPAKRIRKHNHKYTRITGGHGWWYVRP